MNVAHVTSKEELNDFVANQKNSQFIQSWQWGEFQEKVSGKVWRLVVKDNEEVVAAAKIITKDLPAGKKYFYCGRGPIITEGADKMEATRLIFLEIEKLAKQEGAMFLRFDPIHNLEEHDYKIKGKEVLIKTHDVQPSKTLILDLSKTEEELLKEMHQKTRYNINLAEKKGVKITEAGKEKFEAFWSLLDQTSDRDQFRPHGRNYYQAMLELEDNPVKLFFAEFEGRLITTALVSFFGDTATYLHGGSANDDRNVMAPYLLQWHCIKLAKAGGQKFYDFHGIDEEKWPGVTKFKKGFGGLEMDYPGTFDLVYDDGWYEIYKMIRKVRRSF